MPRRKKQPRKPPVCKDCSSEIAFVYDRARKKWVSIEPHSLTAADKQYRAFPNQVLYFRPDEHVRHFGKCKAHKAAREAVEKVPTPYKDD